MLSKLRIMNFRGIKDLELELDRIVVLIGENNACKSAVFAAMQLAFSALGSRRRVVFEHLDFHLADEYADSRTAGTISITLTFREARHGEWDEQTVGRLARLKILQTDAADGCSQVEARVTCWYDETGGLEQNCAFLNLAGEPLHATPETAATFVYREVAFYYLAALRDAGRHFDAKGLYWREFLKADEMAPEAKAELEGRLRELNELVVGSHPSFEIARERLKKVRDVLPLGPSDDVVSIEAVPGRVADMLSRAQLHIGTSSGARIPIGRHGEGTQSLAVLMLFSAFLEDRTAGAPIVALEEPEVHLHPSAVRALWPTIQEIRGQKIVSTHSGDLLSEVPAAALRRLVMTASGVQAFRLKSTTLDVDEERKFNFHIRHARGELLFARCWILVEGETEITLLREIAQDLGLNLERLGIRCVPHRTGGVEMFLKVARDLGISWCALIDNDDQGRKDKKQLENYSVHQDLVFVMPEPDIEHHLCANGFGSIYQTIYDAHPQLHLQPAEPQGACPACGRGARARAAVSAMPGDETYFPQLLKAIKNVLVKPAAALSACTLISDGYVSVPPLFEKVLRRAVQLAGDAP